MKNKKEDREGGEMGRRGKISKKLRGGKGREEKKDNNKKKK